MPNALIVDDSKTARYVLRQLLIKEQISSDMVESAEEALDYLEEQRPDLIFMDHMMPGMDGFQAVKLIKSNPATSAIPIVMYTSSHGGVYFGQARALGAADVIAKPATARDLQDVLRRLEAQAQRTEARQPEAGEAAASGEPDSQLAHDALAPPDGVAAESLTPWSTQASASDLRTGLAGTAGAGRRLAANDEVPGATEPAGAQSVPARHGWARWMAVLAAAVALVMGVLYLNAIADNRALQGRLDAALDGLQWSLDQPQEYPYGAAPLADERLVRLQELLVYLQAAGFEGVVRVESHVGEFCLVEAEGDGPLVPATGEIPITDCAALGQSEAAGLQLAARAAPAFERFVDTSPLLRDGRIQVELLPRGSAQPATPYPASPTVSAAAWNRIAQQNNRVVFALLPR